MNVCIITGSAGLIGSESARYFSNKMDKIIGIDNDQRAYFFGDEASTTWNRRRLEAELSNYEHFEIDIRDYTALERIFREYGNDINSVIHTAAQPSHDWAAKEPVTDFTINANGTLNLLELTRLYSPNTV